jgi:hypothetical protein
MHIWLFWLQSVLDSQVFMNTNEAVSLMEDLDHVMSHKSSIELTIGGNQGCMPFLSLEGQFMFLF